MVTVQRSVGEFYAKLPNKGVGGNSFGMTPPDCMVGLANMFRQSCLFCFSYKESLLFGSPYLNAYQTELTLGLSDIYVFAKYGINRVRQSVAPSVHGSVLA